MHPPDPKPLISRYRLRARGFLNAISNRREFEGALIRIDGGFGCIHPWPELGDPPLEKCLADLAGARRWPIVKRAVRCAEYDRVAREFRALAVRGNGDSGKPRDARQGRRRRRRGGARWRRDFPRSNSRPGANPAAEATVSR